MTRIAHIINPVKVNQNSDLFFAQPVTFESMRIAKNNAQCNVDLYTVQYDEDQKIIPKHFTVLPNLQQSVLDINGLLINRKLPLIKDILEALLKNSEAEYFVFTNVDIGLMPEFYNKVQSYIKKGHDAIIINRRRLSEKYLEGSDLKEIYKDKGKSHPGFDCFIFKKDLLQHFLLDNICVGIPFLGVALAYNLFSFSNNILYVPNKHLTFHIGTDVLPKRNNEFYKHNFNCFFNHIKPQLKPHFSLKNFPYSDRFLLTQFFKFVLNPSLQTLDFLEMEFPSFFKTNKHKAKVPKYNSENMLFGLNKKLNEIRWWLLER